MQIMMDALEYYRRDQKSHLDWFSSYAVRYRCYKKNHFNLTRASFWYIDSNAIVITQWHIMHKNLKICMRGNRSDIGTIL